MSVRRFRCGSSPRWGWLCWRCRSGSDARPSAVAWIVWRFSRSPGRIFIYWNIANNHLVYARERYQDTYGAAQDRFHAGVCAAAEAADASHLFKGGFSFFGPLNGTLDTRMEVTFGYNPLEAGAIHAVPGSGGEKPAAVERAGRDRRAPGERHVRHQSGRIAANLCAGFGVERSHAGGIAGKLATLNPIARSGRGRHRAHPAERGCYRANHRVRRGSLSRAVQQRSPRAAARGGPVVSGLAG